MSGIKDQAELEAIRKRLYERGMTPRSQDRVQLSDITPTVPREWLGVPTPPPKAPIRDPRDTVMTDDTLTVVHPPRVIKKKTYRTIILMGAIALFLLVVGATGLYMFLGNNQISNKNIDVSIAGPITVGGGEVLPLEITVRNDNTVPIEGAVLIVNLPPGTKSDGDNPRDMLEERI